MNRDEVFGLQVGEHAGRPGSISILLGGTGAALCVMLGLSVIGKIVRGDMENLGNGLVTAFASAVVALLCGTVAFAQTRRRIHLYERGLLLVGLFGSRRVAFSEIARVQHINDHARLALRDGSRLVLEGFQNFPQLVAMLRHGAQR